MQLSALSLHVVPFWAALDNHDSTTIVTEHCEGDLRSVLEQAGGALSESAVRAQVAAPLLEVLVHMHRLGFVHRDIKPENVFVSGKHSMLGDFGLAIALPSAATGDSNISGISSSPRCCSSSLTAGSDSSSASLQAGGTPAYVAPEVVQATFNNTSLEVAVGPQNDVWNLGVLVWETLAGRHPFGDHTSSPEAENVPTIFADFGAFR
ncbi:hypothetical protein OEZ86_004322 [Tetradesmus obliquus]|nr:hypothetical protein OEZ86_004322 [Tetradesmus obliquus]